MDAFYFDGLSSKRHATRLEAQSGCLWLTLPSGEKRVIPLRDIRVSEPQGSAPRTLRFPDNDFCEVPQNAELLALLKALGCRETTVMRLQGRWRWAVSALAALFLVFGAAYQWLLPWGANLLAPHVPLALLDHVSTRALDWWDRTKLFEPSKIPEARQNALSERFRQLAASDPELAPHTSRLRLYFRDYDSPNAFAMPGGQVILLDRLAALASDDEVIAVLAHEIGHFRKRHVTRQIIQSSFLGAFIAFYLGDASWLFSGTTAVLLESNYSRNMELEADDYAVVTLRRVGLSPLLLASALKKLEGWKEDGETHETKSSPENTQNTARPESKNTPNAQSASPSQTTGNTPNASNTGKEEKTEKPPEHSRRPPFRPWFSTHPDTEERVLRIQQAAGSH